jgi:rhamnogalacturonyl hydrolase YesR
MNTATQKELSLECIRIADELLGKAVKTDNGWAWDTMFLGNDREVSWEKIESIYSGTSGIILLFIELYKRTGDAKYFEAAVKGGQWIEWYCNEKPTEYYAFFTGRLGAAYTMVKLSELTGEESYLEKAQAIARQSIKFLDFARPLDDLINGYAGTILGLLHIHAATGDKELLPIIDKFIKTLIDRAHFGAEGLYWDRGRDQVHGLCGFSHGAAGVGFVFLELAHYFKNDAFNTIAEQAFLYETHHFDAARGNWPDFRKGYHSDKMYSEFRKAYLDNDIKYFTRVGDMSAWCHGAPGIGFSRLRAYQLLKDETYRKHLGQAIEKTKSTTVDADKGLVSYTLCHGGGGNSMLFIDAYRALGDERYMQLAEEVAVRAVKSKKEVGVYLPGLSDAGMKEDTSLFMGNAGIAYFYLQVMHPSEVPSVLAPVVDAVVKEDVSLNEYEWISISKAKLTEYFLMRHFPRTIDLLKKEGHSIFDAQADNKEDILSAFIQHASVDVFPLLKENAREKLGGIFHIEREKSRLQNMPSRALLNIQDDLGMEAAKHLLSLKDDELLGKELQLHRNAVIIPFRGWGGEEEEDEGAVLLRPHVNGVMEEQLMPFLQVVLEAFEQPVTVKAALENILESFECESEQEKKETKLVILQQVKQALMAGFLEADPVKVLDAEQV